VGGGAQNVQAAVQRNLKNLSVGKPRAVAAPTHSKIGTGVNTVIDSKIKRAGRGGVIDLDGPDRKIGQGAAACSADVRPCHSTVNSLENMTISAKLVDYCVGDLGVSGIDLHLIDSGAARRQIVLRPHRPMVGGNENLAAGGELSSSRGIDYIDI
jgi:hypothetical protein